MTPTDLEILRDALHCLRTYRRLAPPDLKPYGRHGHNTDTVISNLELVISKHKENHKMCRTCDVSEAVPGMTVCAPCYDEILKNALTIPQLRAIKNRPVTLDKEAWR